MKSRELAVPFSIAIWFLLLFGYSNSSLFAQLADNPSQSLSNLIAVIEGKLPIAAMEVELDGKTFAQEGFAPKKPLTLEAGWQKDSFFVRKNWGIISNQMVTLNPAAIWGQNSTSRWIVEGGNFHLSVHSVTNKSETDPVHQEVEVYKTLANIGRRLGFPPTIAIESFSSHSLKMVTEKGESVIASVNFAEQGRIRSIDYGFTNSLVTAKVTIEYEYALGDRPDWMPAVIKVSAQEVMSNGRRFSYSDTHRILKCDARDLQLINGFSPEMFLHGVQVQKSLIWSNGIGTQIVGTNVTPILPPDTPSAALPHDGKARWIRVVVIGSILSISFVFLLFLKRRKNG